MDFINEEDVALLEIGENASEVGGFLHGQPADGAEVRAHHFGKDVGERGLAEAERSADENMIERFAAMLGRGDAHIKALLHLGLPPEISEDCGPERLLKDSGRLG